MCSVEVQIYIVLHAHCGCQSSSLSLWANFARAQDPSYSLIVWGWSESKCGEGMRVNSLTPCSVANLATLLLDMFTLATAFKKTAK